MPAQQLRTTIVEGLSGSARVDRDAGVIRNVKLIGFESKNGRYYPPSALKAAVHLYEGAKVNIDHPEGNDPAKPRKYGERFGVIRGARFVEGQGNFGDFHFNPKHPQAEQVIWDAENNPESLGFSHNALLRMGPTKSGKQTVESIINIRSMDLVADPATTMSLFESEDPMDPTETPAAAGAGDPKSQVKDAFKQMIIAAVDDSSLDMKATMKKIGEIMKAQAKLMGVEAPAEPAGDTEPTEESVQLKQQVGLLKQQLEQYRAKENEAKRIAEIDAALESAGLDRKNPAHVSELFAKQLLATESVDDRKALIADRAALLGAKSHTEGVGNPIYKPTGGTTNATEQIDAKALASRLLC